MVLKSFTAQDKIKLDLYDKKLLFYLADNSRTPQSELAKKLRISLQRLHYKIQRLQKELINPAVVLNYCLLGIPSYIVYAERLDEATKNQLMETSALFLFLQTIGRYQYCMIIVTPDIQAFCKEYLPTQVIEMQLIIKYIPDNYNPFKLDLIPAPLKKDKECTLDKKDYKILAHISEHPLHSLLEIQANTKIDRQTIKERLSKLEKSNIIQKFRYAINIFKLGMIQYFLKIELPMIAKEKLLPHLRRDTYSGFVFEVYTGFVMYYMPPSHNELFEFVEKIKMLEPMARVDILQCSEFFKVEPVPQSVIEIFKKKSV